MPGKELQAPKMRASSFEKSQQSLAINRTIEGGKEGFRGRQHQGAVNAIQGSFRPADLRVVYRPNSIGIVVSAGDQICALSEGFARLPFDAVGIDPAVAPIAQQAQ
jgi:hypothetical protein